MALQYVKEQTPEICLAAVEQNGWALQYVREQIPEICLTAVKQDGLALQYVKEQTSEICLAAVTQNGEALIYVEEQTLEIYLAVIKQHVKEQTFKIYLEAVEESSNALQFVKRLYKSCKDKPKLQESTKNKVAEQKVSLEIKETKQFIPISQEENLKEPYLYFTITGKINQQEISFTKDILEKVMAYLPVALEPQKEDILDTIHLLFHLEL